MGLVFPVFRTGCAFPSFMPFSQAADGLPKSFSQRLKKAAPRQLLPLI